MKKQYLIITTIVIVVFGLATAGYFVFYKTKDNPSSNLNKHTSTVSVSNEELTSDEINTIAQSTLFVSTGHREVDAFGTGTFFPTERLQYYTNMATAKHDYKNSYLKEHIGWVLTNRHVVEGVCGEDFDLCPSIRFPTHQDFPDHILYTVQGYYTPVYQTGYYLFPDRDLALLLFSEKCLDEELGGGCWGRNEFNENLSESEIKTIPVCKDSITIGTKVWIFGYPIAAAEIDFLTEEGTITGANLIVSSGIISGLTPDGYYTDASVDAGNSGGMAYAKQNGEVCIVGVPTWASVGDLTSLGVIQDIRTIIN